MSKYYTPKIEEFHVGFEYEHKIRLRGGIMSYVNDVYKYKDEWQKSVFRDPDYEPKLFIPLVHDSPRFIEIVETYLRDGAIRVKSLDVHDIKELEWIEGIDKQYYLINEDDLVLYRLVLLHEEVYMITNDRNDVKFEGEIKNKSELRKIMKQIGIEI